MKFDLLNYNELKKEMTVLEKQVPKMCDIDEQFIPMKFDLTKDHNEESQNLKRWQQIHTLLSGFQPGRKDRVGGEVQKNIRSGLYRPSVFIIPSFYFRRRLEKIRGKKSKIQRIKIVVKCR